ncbi:hypothetical protein R2B67_11220 [Streptomyces cyaneofuscatus]|uniref:hypothetical protein n=1 Tax=Streptomyces cyaneofuscatus TaxID=66883 RepID=UPI0029548AC7|nr:hypothetical protein [Streptomyces cyaneofuscatus]WOP13977.1 hypothetical protein R2B67_11220 [Streptomyces cyaneofuscatus]
MSMNAECGEKNPEAPPNPSTVSLRSPQQNHGDSHGARTTPPGAVWAIHAGGTARTEQVATTRS